MYTLDIATYRSIEMSIKVHTEDAIVRLAIKLFIMQYTLPNGQCSLIMNIKLKLALNVTERKSDTVKFKRYRFITVRINGLVDMIQMTSRLPAAANTTIG